MNDSFLKASLYLHAVLPVVPLLAAHDLPLAAILAGPDFAVALSAPGGLGARLAFAGGRLTWSREPKRGDSRLWFPSSKHLVRAFEEQTRLAIAVPLAGLGGLYRARRLVVAARRFSFLLEQRSPTHLALHTWGRFAVAVGAAAVWLRVHHQGPAEHAALGQSVAVFDCPAFPAPLWLNLSTLEAGTGTPPAEATARVTFADLDTALAELDQQLDAPAAIGLGKLRVDGHLPFADRLGVVMERAGALLQPPAHASVAVFPATQTAAAAEPALAA